MIHHVYRYIIAHLTGHGDHDAGRVPLGHSPVPLVGQEVVGDGGLGRDQGGHQDGHQPSGGQASHHCIYSLK